MADRLADSAFRVALHDMQGVCTDLNKLYIMYVQRTIHTGVQSSHALYSMHTQFHGVHETEYGVWNKWSV